MFVTRLHVRYDAAHFPEDLAFQETADRTNFQGRYVLRHAWKGEGSCEAAAQYRARPSCGATSRRPRAWPPSPGGTSTPSARRWAACPRSAKGQPRSFWDRLFGR